MLERAPLQPAPHRPDPAVIQISPVSGRSVLRLRSWLPEFSRGGKPVILDGRELPAQVGEILPGQVRALCVSPGEWLLVSTESDWPQPLRPEESTQGLVLVDLTDGLAIIDVRGSAAREILCKGCGLDLHPRSFPAGRCARTRFAQIPVVVECLGPSRFELYVARSYLHYLHSWLEDAAVEFGDTLP